jgi:hypothetical protein
MVRRAFASIGLALSLALATMVLAACTALAAFQQSSLADLMRAGTVELWTIHEYSPVDLPQLVASADLIAQVAVRSAKSTKPTEPGSPPTMSSTSTTSFLVRGLTQDIRIARSGLHCADDRVRRRSDSPVFGRPLLSPGCEANLPADCHSSAVQGDSLGCPSLWGPDGRDNYRDLGPLRFHAWNSGRISPLRFTLR